MAATPPRADDPAALVEQVRRDHLLVASCRSCRVDNQCHTCSVKWPCLPARLAEALERQLAIYAEYGAISSGAIEDMRRERDALRADATALRPVVAAAIAWSRGDPDGERRLNEAIVAYGAGQDTP